MKIDDLIKDINWEFNGYPQSVKDDVLAQVREKVDVKNVQYVSPCRYLKGDEFLIVKVYVFDLTNYDFDIAVRYK